MLRRGAPRRFPRCPLSRPKLPRVALAVSPGHMIPFLGQRWPLGHGEGAGPQGGPRSPRSQCCTSPSDGAPGAVVGSSSGAAPPFWPRSGSHSPWCLSPSSWPAWCNSSVFPRGASVCPCQACGQTRPEPAPAQPPVSVPAFMARGPGGAASRLRCAVRGRAGRCSLSRDATAQGMRATVHSPHGLAGPRAP